MTLEFQGAARTVTGSMHLLHVNGKRLLLDCGMFQGRREEANQRNRTFPFDPRSIDAIVLSHAHIDHSGNIPGIVRQGYTGPVYCTPATKDLCAIMLADSGHIQEKDAEFFNKKKRKPGEPPIVPLYTADDAAAALRQFNGVPYEKVFDVLPNVQVRFVDAGHILGSASVHLTIRDNNSVKTLGFSGDVGRRNMPIIRDPVFMGDVDYLICESTYGGVTHAPPQEMDLQLAGVLSATVARGGKLIVPAFSVGRTQDIVYALHRLFDAGQLSPIPIYVDSPLAINATDIYKNHPECFDEETRDHLLRHHDPLGLSQLHYVRSAEESKQLNDRAEPCMIIAASGMCEGGRVLHHLVNNLGDAKNTVLIVGFQAEHTLGRRLVENAEEVRIFGEVYRRNAQVSVLDSFSAHADGPELAGYIGRFDRRKLKKIFLVHGEYSRQQALQQQLLQSNAPPADIPVRGEKFDL